MFNTKVLVGTRIDELRLLTKVSKLYYEQGHTQEEIAERLRVSRPKISRLLQKARDARIVQIAVLSPTGVYADLERRVEYRYGLREVHLVETSDYTSQEVVSKEVGVAAAEYLRRLVRDGDIVGLSWGTTLGAMVNALLPTPKEDVTIVQIIGGLGPPEAETHATDLAKRVARALNARLRLLLAPGIVADTRLKEVFLSDVLNRQAVDLGARANVAFVGIGVPTPTSVVMRDGSIMTEQELQGLKNSGAVGDIALRFFNAEGKPVESELDDRVIGLTLDQLKQIDLVVGVAGGQDKFAVIRAALVGNLVKALVTDHITGQRLLDEPVR